MRDFELGVPFPGEILPGDRWTKTGYRDDGKPFDWERVFGRSAPRVVDLGCGNGRYLVGSALARPTHDHVGIDEVQRVIDFAAHRGNARGVANVRFVTADAPTWLFEKLDALDEIHVYHPQPYYEERDVAKRMLTARFLERAWQILRPGGVLVLQTDNKSYWKYLVKAVEKHFEAEIVPGPWPDAPEGRTRRELIARKKGLTVWRMIGHRREAPLDVEIPKAAFDANRPKYRKKRR